MTRVALLPAGADPFLTAYWLRHYRTWASEVDELKVLYCGQENPEAQDYIARIVAGLPNATLEIEPNRIVHGDAIRRLVEGTNATHVMLCEDDAFVRRPGVVDRHFHRVEFGLTDIVGCPRGNTNPKVVEAAIRRFGAWETTESGEVGHSLWPCFLFARRSDLLRTDRNFGSATWDAGELIAPLDYRVDEVSAADTFVSASWQLRAMGLRVALESEFRIEEAKLFDWGHIPWFHVGSLSSGYGSHFMGITGDAYRARVRIISAETEKADWYKRVSFWIRAWRAWDGELKDLHQAYGQALHQFMADIEIDEDRVERWDRGFAGLVTWPEV